MNKITTFLNRMKKRMYLAVKRYPIAVVLILFAAAMVMVTIDINENNRALEEDLFIRLAMTAVFGAVLSLTIKSTAERFRFKKAVEWLSYILVPALMLPVYFMLMPDFDNMEVMLKYLLTTALTASLFFFVPFIKSEKSASYFAQKVFLRLAVTMIYYGIILGGVEAIIFAVENLLSVEMPNGIYIHTAACLAGLFIPAFFFAGIPEPDDTQSSYPKLLKILLHYIVFPLLSAYSVVLYAYFIKILVEWQLPSNLLGNLVIYYSLISIAALYFGHFTKDESRWTRIFTAVFPYVIILPTLMMLLSFIVRVREYGFTEPRYYAILCVIFVLRSISMIKLQKKVRVIPLALSILLLVSIFGPLSSFNISNWSQNRRFERILTEAGMLEEGKIIPNPGADDETRREVTAIVDYFSDRERLDDMKFIQGEFERSDMVNLFGFSSYYILDKLTMQMIDTDYSKTRIINTEGYDFIAELNPYAEPMKTYFNGSTITVKTQSEGLYTMSILLDGEKIYSKNMLDMLAPYFEGEHKEDVSGGYVFTEETDEISVRMIILSARWNDKTMLSYDIKLLFSVK